MSKKRDRESNADRESRSKDQLPPSPENSASIHRHPKMMCGLQEQLTRVKGKLVSDHANGVLAVEEVIASLHNSDHEPFPGFTENMITEFSGIGDELGELDPNQPGAAQRFGAMAKRINFLSQMLSFVVGYSLSVAENNTSVVPPNATDARP